MREAIDLASASLVRRLHSDLSGGHRVADHMWWITDLTEFRNDYPGWNVTYNVDEILREIHAANVAQWTTAA